MTIMPYSLFEFSTWLNEDKSRKKDYLWGNSVWRLLNGHHYFSKAPYYSEKFTYFDDILGKYLEVVNQWIDEKQSQNASEESKKKITENTKPMTKQDLQKELQEKVKAGVKPSDLRKLKRSRSEGDIPSTNIPLPPPPPLTKSTQPSSFTDPQYPYTTLIAQQQEIEKLTKETQAKSDTIKLFREREEKLTAKKDQLVTELTKVNQQIKELNDLVKPNNLNIPPRPLLQDQLTEKQAEIEELRAKLETANTELTELKTPLSQPADQEQELSDLDQSLVARHKSLRDWFTEHEKTVKLEAELAENIDYASEELIRQDDLIDKLRTENRQLKIKQHSLQKDLDLAERAVNFRTNPYLFNDPHPFLPLAFFLVTTLFLTLIIKRFSNG